MPGVPVTGIPDMLVMGALAAMGGGLYYIALACRIEERREARAARAPDSANDGTYDPAKLAPEPRLMGAMLVLLCLLGIIARLS